MRHALLFLVLCLIWGFTYVALKIGLRYAPPLTFTFARALIGGLALGGYALVTTRRFPTDAFTHGAAVALGGGFFWAVGTVLFRAWQRRLDILWTTALQALYGAVPLALLAFAVERPHFDVTVELGWTLAFTGLGSAGLAYLIYFYLLRHRDVAEVNSFVFLVPFFAVLFGAVILGERLGPISLVGAALILAGIYVVGTRARRAPASTKGVGSS